MWKNTKFSDSKMNEMIVNVIAVSERNESFSIPIKLNAIFSKLITLNDKKNSKQYILGIVKTNKK